MQRRAKEGLKEVRERRNREKEQLFTTFTETFTINQRDEIFQSLGQSLILQAMSELSPDIL